MTNTLDVTIATTHQVLASRLRLASAGVSAGATRQIVDALMAAIGVRASDALANRLYLTEVKAPTRPHPYAPRGGSSALLARLIWARADRFWDGLEGRAIPTSTGVRTRPRRGLMTQYVMGNPADEPTAEAS